MRRLMLVLVVLLVPGFVMAGPDRSQIFEDCVFWRSATGATVTLDTLWFSATQANAGTGLSYDGVTTGEHFDAFLPTAVPYDHNNDGTLKYRTRPVKRLLLYSRVPFTYRAFNGGRVAPSAGVDGVRAWFDVADTNSSVSAYNVGQVSAFVGDEFPCWAVIAYPDSVYVAEAGGDSVQVDVGY